MPTASRSIIARRKPTDNAFTPGAFHAECLNTRRFMSLDDARSKLEDWPSAWGDRAKAPITLHHHDGDPSPPIQADQSQANGGYETEEYCP
jgi:hypothetical protein